jgi:senataxin
MFAGKTRTVIGIISCLLSASKKQFAASQAAQLRPDTSSSADTTFSVHNNSHAKRPPKKSRLMVCAPSNGGVDELLMRILENGVVDEKGKIIAPKIVRLGKPLEGTSHRIVDVTLDVIVENEVMKDKMWDILTKSTQEYNTAQKALREIESGFFAGDKTTAKTELQTTLRKHRTAKIKAELYVNMKRVEIKRHVLETADIVAATLSSSGQYLLLDHILQHDIRFDTVIIDEAGQATEPAALIPLRYGCKQLVLVGDARQLPAYVCSKEAERAGLGVSLFERFEQAGHEVVMLTVRI